MNVPWGVGEIFDTPEDQYEYWSALFESSLDEHAPKKRMRVREKEVPYKSTQGTDPLRIGGLRENGETLLPTRQEKLLRTIGPKSQRRLRSTPANFYKTFNPFL